MSIDLKTLPTDEEIEALRALLMSDRVSPDRMTLSEMDGYLTGITVGPAPPPPDEWVPVIFGEPLPVWQDEEEGGLFGATILRRLFQIANGLDTDPPRVGLWLDRDADGTVDPTAWANGFLHAIALAPERWLSMFKVEEGMTFLMPILAYSNPEADLDEADDILPLNEEMEEALAELRTNIGDDVEDVLTDCVIGVNAYWLDAKSRAPSAKPKKKRVKHTRPRRRK